MDALAWIDPKTNYINSDKFNAEDFNRIIGNIKELAGKAARLKKKPDIIDQEEKDAVNYTSLIYADDFNSVIKNINTINAAAYDIALEAMVTYKDGGKTPMAAELNTIEGNIEKMAKNINANYANMEKLEFNLGNYKGIRI